MKFVKITIVSALVLVLVLILPHTYLAVVKHENVLTTNSKVQSKNAEKIDNKNNLQNKNKNNLQNKAINNLEAAQNKENIEIENKDKLEESAIESYLGNNLNNVAIVYYDIDSKQQISINPDKVFLAGSTVKVQLNMVLADMFQSGQASESETLTYKPSDYESGTGILQGTDLSKPYPITTLSDYSILHSDNIATNMLIDRIGYQNFRNAVDVKLGQTTDHSGNYVTAQQETTLLTQLYENKNNNPYYSHIIEDMKNTDFHDRIDKYIDHSIVAHKIGDYSNYVNDVGIVYTSKPYIVSIYTQGVPNADEVIAQVSKMIYNYQMSN
jgi:beta-lactamase class A